MKDNWDDLKTILYLVRLGSLTAAAEALNINYTTVARRIAAAEQSYGVRLFDRLPSGYVPTKAALDAAKYARAMEAEQSAFQRQLAGSENDLRGAFLITAPPVLIGPYLAEVIKRFTREHPQVDLTVRATYTVLNLNRREADLAIRVSDKPGDTLVGQRLARQHTASFAAPEMAEKIRRAPDECIDWIGLPDWRGPPKASQRGYPNAQIKLRFDDIFAIAAAAKAGLGVARMPMFIGRSTAGLEQVPVLPPQPYADIWVVSHRDLKSSAKVKAFKKILIPYFKAHSADFIDDRTPL